MKNLFLSLFLFLSHNALAISEADLLPTDQAFKASILDVTEDNVAVKFVIADKYYLYKHAFQFSNENLDLKLSEALIPDGKKKVDEFFGEVESYRNELVINIPFENTKGVAADNLTIKYQGCADIGVCYPPQKKNLNFAPLLVDSQADSNLLGSTLDSSNGLDFGTDNWLGQTQTIPTVEQAFKVETIAMESELLSTRFTIQPNIYLYKDKLEVKSLTDGVVVKEIKSPQGVDKDDPHFGKVQVYFDQAEFDVVIARNNPSVNKIELQIDYQGCVDEGICYPPASKSIIVELSNLATVSNNNQPAVQLSEQSQIQKDIEDETWWLTVLKFFGFGLLLALTPCVFPMIPILSGLIVGQGDISRSKAFSLSLVYVLAMALAYTAAGVIAGLLGANIQAAFQKPWIIILFSGIFVLLALSMFGLYELQIPASWQKKLSNISNKQKGGSMVGVAIMGFLSAIIVGPCVAPPLAGAVLFISESGNPVVGGLALFAMSIGMGVPLLLIGASAGKWMPQSGGWMNVVKSFFGIALIGMAIWFLSRIIPAPVSLALYGLLAIATAIFWYSYAVKAGVSPTVKALLGLFRILLFVVGLLQFYGAFKGHTDPLKPWKKYTYFEFTKIKSTDDLILKMQESDKPVLLDFYADWCIECIRMEKSTYNQPEVQKELERFLVLKADVTAQDEVDVELMKTFKIIGPPATLFFDADDKMINHQNFFGFMGADEFTEHLRKIK